jgi:uncharacterized repeat protein (TIGR01451 family)/fimbrial isopeptide formation D2 family protein
VLADERTGADVADTAPTTINQALTTGALNNYALSSTIVNNAVNNATVAKSVVTTSQGGADGLGTPGELITYRLTVTLPEGVVPDLRIQDAIPSGMAYITGSLTLDTTGFVGSVVAPAVSGIGGATFIDGRDVLFDFASTTVTDDNITTNNTFSFTYQAVVLDVVSNDGITPGTTTLTNTATHNNGAGGTFSFAGGSAAIAVVEPQLSVTKTRSVATGDAGDPVSYTITVAHAAGSLSGAFDLNLTDTLPAGFTATGFVVGGTSAAVAGDFDLNLGTGAFTTTGTFNLALAQTLTITISGSLNTTVEPNQTIPNTANLTYDSQAGNITDRDNSDLVTDRQRTTSTSGNVNITTPFVPQVSKALIATSESTTAGNTVVVGEIVRYEIRVELFEGTNRGLVVRDFLPAGLQFLPANVEISYENVATTITGTAAGTFDASASALISTSLTADADVYADGTDVFFKLGTLVNNDNDSANREFVVIRYNALVLNTAGNQTAATHANNFGVLLDTDNNGTSGFVSVDRNASGTATGTEVATDADNDGSDVGDIAGLSNDIVTTVAEPTLTLVQVVSSSPGNPNAGDLITYQVTLTNTGNATAFNASFLDTLSDGLTLVGGTLAHVSGTDLTGSLTLTNGAISLTTVAGGFTLGAGATSTFEYQVRIPVTVVDAQALDTASSVIWTSLPGTGTVGGANTPGDSTPGASGATTGERDGSQSPALNDYRATTSTLVTSNLVYALTKTATATSDASTGTALGDPLIEDLTIGETVTFTLVVTLAEGTTNALNIVDTLPFSVATGTTAGTLVFESAALVSTGANVTAGAPVITNTGTNSEIVTFAFGNVTVAGTNGNAAAALRQITLTVTARVANTVTNQTGDLLTNNAALNSTSTSDTVTASAQVEVVEPRVTVSKTVTSATTGLDAGDSVTYQITVSNLAANGATATA